MHWSSPNQHALATQMVAAGEPAAATTDGAVTGAGTGTGAERTP